MRAFIGIFPPDNIKKEFKGIQDKLFQYKKFIRFVYPSSVHITLKYLGNNVNDAEVNKLISELKIRLNNFSSFNIRLNEVQFGFRGEKWPRIIFVSVFRNDSMNKLLNIIGTTIDGLSLPSLEDFRVENTIYHFTLGRKRRDLSRDMVNKITSRMGGISLQDGFIVKRVDFVSSILTSEGPKYSTIDHIKFRSDIT